MKDFIAVGKYLEERGLVVWGAGVLSQREGEQVKITKNWVRLGNVQPEDILEVNLNQGEGGEVAADFSVHQTIYKNSKAQAIVQFQGPYALALSVTENRFIPLDALGTKIFRAVPIARIREPKPEEISRLIVGLVNDQTPAILAKGYAAFCLGKNLEEAAALAQSLEISAQATYLVKSLNAARQPSALPTHNGRRGPQNQKTPHRSLPPSIGVMDRSRDYRRGR